MDALNFRLRDDGHHGILEWLRAHPKLTWKQVGQALGFPPVAIMKKLTQECSRPEYLREALYRGFVHPFPEGWNNTDDWSKAKWGSELAAHFALNNSQLLVVMERMANLPLAWLPESSEDPYLRRVVASIDAVPAHPYKTPHDVDDK